MEWPGNGSGVEWLKHTTSDEDVRTLINNRQNGRRGRGRGNGMRPMNGGGGGQDRGNRIDNRARGNANQLHEKYKTLARDAQMQGDRVMTEYYLQFADHYFRVLSETRGRFEEQRRQRGDFQDDFDGDEGEGEVNAAEAGERFERAERHEEQPRRNGEANGHAHGDRQPRFERRERPLREERRPPRETGEERQQFSFVEEPAVVVAVPAPAPVVEAEEAAPVRRPRGRPRRERPVEAETSARIDSDGALPAFLAEPAPEPAEAAPEAPRRRRAAAATPRRPRAGTASAEA